MYGQYNPYQQMPMYGYGQKTEIVKVSGENGARAYTMPPNSSILLLDEQNPIVWLKVTDGAGYPTITPYQITPYQAEKEPDYKSLEMRIAKIEEMLNESDT